MRNLQTSYTKDGSVIIKWEKPFGAGCAKPAYLITYNDKEMERHDTQFTLSNDGTVGDHAYNLKVYKKSQFQFLLLRLHRSSRRAILLKYVFIFQELPF